MRYPTGESSVGPASRETFSNVSGSLDLQPQLAAALADRYTIERELGRGGMAIVYLALEHRHGRRVALKVLRPDFAPLLGAERFVREIAVAARLSHPNLIPLYDSGEAAGQLYYTMPYIEGESLRQRLDREGPLPIDDCRRIAVEVAHGLAYAHAAGILHRDIKPGNILLSSEQAVVADFGLARAISLAGEERLSSSGLCLGTPQYMSPEQGAAGGDVDARADLYSLGCVLYEMLVGAPPFTGPTAQAVLARHACDVVPPIRTVRPEVPSALEAIVRRALAKIPADRFPDASAMAEALAHLPSDTVTTASRGGRPLVTRRLLGGGAVIAAAAGVVVGLRALGTRRPVDATAVLVLPVVTAGRAAGQPPAAEDVTTALVAALNSTAALRAVDGWRLLDDDERRDVRALPAPRAAGLARAQRARYYVRATLLTEDSLRLSLDATDIEADTSRARTLVFSHTAGAWAIGVGGARALLAALLAPSHGRPGAPLDRLNGRDPAAIASFFRAEQAYRRARFTDAIAAYRQAVDADSGFTLAALRGAEAATWAERTTEGAAFTRVALDRRAELPPRYVAIAEGLAAYFASQADSAVRHFQAAIDLDPGAPEAWMGLGETYTHLLPTMPAPDSLAGVAFAAVHRLDPGFVPVLYHLIEIAGRRGDREAVERYVDQFEHEQADSTELVPALLILECVRRSDRIDWTPVARRHPDALLQAGASFVRGGLRQPRCAEDAWQALVDADTGTSVEGRNRRFAALLGLQTLLAAEGRRDELGQLLARDTVFNADYHGDLYLLDAAAGVPVAAEAERAAARLRELERANPSAVGSVRQWLLGVWDTETGRWDEARALSQRLLREARQDSGRRDTLLSQSLAARVALGTGDTAAARARLQALRPTAPKDELQWSPWESLGGERLLLARILLSQGAAADALDVTAEFDAPAPVAYALYLPAALAIRAKAAEALGDTKQADRCHERLAVLQRPRE